MFRYGWIGFIHSIFEERLRYVSELHDITERTIFDEKDNFEKFLDRESEKLDEETKQDFYEHYLDEFQKYKDEFPTISRSSLFLNCFFSFENFLHDLCIYFDDRSEHNLNDTKDKGLKKYKNFLGLFVKDKHFFGTQIWERMIFYRDLRNAFTHADGNLKLSSNQRLIKKLKKEDNLTITDRNEVRLKKHFLDEVTSNLNTFSEELYKQLESHAKG